MNNLVLALLIVINTVFITGCGSDSFSLPQSIVITGTVTSAADNLPIGNAQVTLVNTETQQNELDPVYTNANGAYTFIVPPGIYEVRTAAQGYKASPLEGISGIPVSQTTTFDVVLEVTDPGVYGWLNLNLVGYSKINGALAILRDTVTGENYTGVTSITGGLMMYNIPAGDYTLIIKSIEHETYTSAANVTFSQDIETTINDISLTATNGYSVSGKVTFLSITNSEVDVSLTDKETGAVIPGTNVNTVSTNYVINSVAPGDYYIRATYKIDGMVVDPDAIVKFGEPEAIVVASDLANQDIDVTGAITLTSPIVPDGGTPVEINDLFPTFTWEPYPSTTDYVVEVRDVHGNVIWGGFSPDAVPTKLVVTTATTILYSNDGLGQILEYGKIYRWKVYASKDDSSITGWNLISASEEAQGVFTVVTP